MSGVRSWDRALATLLALATITWLLATEGKQGIGRDEAQYMRAGERYWGWFAELGDHVRAGRPRASFTPAAIDRYWSDNAPDHPVVMKVLYGVSWRLFSGPDAPAGVGLHPIPAPPRKGVFPVFKRPSTAFRFPAILVAGALAALTFSFARRFLPRIPSVVASGLTIAQPHYFFHAAIACFDAPVTFMAVAVGYAYWRSLRSLRWGLATGLIFGLALGVKHNAWLMPVFLVGHWLWLRRGDLRRFRFPPIPVAFLSMALVGPVVFLAHWPWLWVNPVLRTRTYVLRHLEHEHYNFEYLGRNWNNPPQELDRKLVRMTFPFVSTALTVPVTTLALAGLGAGVLLRRRRRRHEGDTDEGGDAASAEGPALPVGREALAVVAPPPTTWRAWCASCARPGEGLDRGLGAFLLVQAVGPMMVLAVPSSPIFGGVKHFMTGWPYLALAAGFGAEIVLRAADSLLSPRLSPRLSARAARWLPAGLAGLLLAPAVIETQRSHPDGLSHYNLLAGGFAGGASLGMNRQFWGYSVLPMLPWIAATAPAPHPIYWHDVLGDALNMYIRDGRLVPLTNAGGGEPGIERSDLSLLVHERHMTLYEGVMWQTFGTRPAYVRTREGVPIVTAYTRLPVAP